MSATPSSGTGFQSVDLRPFETDIDTANRLISEWGRIAASIARQCKWRPRGKCYARCLGLAVCNLEGLILVDDAGRPIGVSGAGVPAHIPPQPPEPLP